VNDDDLATDVVNAARDVNIALQAFRAAQDAATRAGLTVRATYNAPSMFAPERFTCGVERRRFIRGFI
jgi:hypothetical protein